MVNLVDFKKEKIAIYIYKPHQILNKYKKAEDFKFESLITLF
jgi:ABC-type proline/glycine betaine transport system substrate-binding protein